MRSVVVIVLLMVAVVTVSAQEQIQKTPAASTSQSSLDLADTNRGFVQPDTDLVDVPTAGVLDYGGYSAKTRFFSNGGVLEWLSFGVFQNLNIGASLSIDRLIGTGDPVKMNPPGLQVKYRFYDGDRVIPAFAIGFDGQGYFYNRPDRRYNQRQRGLYIMGSQEVLVPGLNAHAGVSMSDFDSNYVFGTVAGSYNIEEKVLLMTEWDNINNVDNSRLNAGLRFYLTEGFHIDFAVRSIGQEGRFSDGVTRAPERIVMLKYIGSI